MAKPESKPQAPTLPKELTSLGNHTKVSPKDLEILGTILATYVRDIALDLKLFVAKKLANVAAPEGEDWGPDLILDWKQEIAATIKHKGLEAALRYTPKKFLGDKLDKFVSKHDLPPKRARKLRKSARNYFSATKNDLKNACFNAVKELDRKKEDIETGVFVGPGEFSKESFERIPLDYTIKEDAAKIDDINLQTLLADIRGRRGRLSHYEDEVYVSIATTLHQILQRTGQRPSWLPQLPGLGDPIDDYENKKECKDKKGKKRKTLPAEEGNEEDEKGNEKEEEDEDEDGEDEPKNKKKNKKSKKNSYYS